MGVPYLLTWLKTQFPSCFLTATSYVAASSGSRRERGAGFNKQSVDVDPNRVGVDAHGGESGEEEAKKILAATVLSPCVDNLYVDVNGLLYQAVTAVTTAYKNGGLSIKGATEFENCLLQELVRFLDTILFLIVKPTTFVFLAMDGVSPIGKMAQQRSRRSASEHRGSSKMLKETFGWDANSMTAGTQFMQRVSDVLEYYASSRVEKMVKLEESRINASTSLSSSSGASTNVESRKCGMGISKDFTIVLSDASTPGEGEVKIFDVIRRLRNCSADAKKRERGVAQQRDDGEKQSTDPASKGDSVIESSHSYYSPKVSHCICSGDTDVVVSCLSLHEPHVSVLRFDPDVHPTTGAVSSSTCDASTMFSIGKFRKELYTRLGCPTDLELFERSLHDFVFVLLLFGNDFLPNLSEDIKISGGQLDALVEFLRDNFVTRGRHIVCATTNTIDFHTACYLLEFVGSLGERSKLKVEGMDGAMDWGFEADESFQKKKQEENENSKGKCYLYWKGLEWALKYSCGECSSWDYTYHFKTVPSVKQLIQHCGIVEDSAAASSSDKQQSGGGGGGAALDVFSQLVLVLPASSVGLLPSGVATSYNEEMAPILAKCDGVTSFSRETLSAVKNWCVAQSSRLSLSERKRLCAGVGSDADNAPTLFTAVIEHWPVQQQRQVVEDGGNQAQSSDGSGIAMRKTIFGAGGFMGGKRKMVMVVDDSDDEDVPQQKADDGSKQTGATQEAQQQNNDSLFINDVPETPEVFTIKNPTLFAEVNFFKTKTPKLLTCADSMLKGRVFPDVRLTMTENNNGAVSSPCVRFGTLRSIGIEDDRNLPFVLEGALQVTQDEEEVAREAKRSREETVVDDSDDVEEDRATRLARIVAEKKAKLRERVARLAATTSDDPDDAILKGQVAQLMQQRH